MADWIGGKNNIGCFTQGISITLPKNGLLNAGYSIGDDSRANSNATMDRHVFLHYGVTFRALVATGCFPGGGLQRRPGPRCRSADLAK